MIDLLGSDRGATLPGLLLALSGLAIAGPLSAQAPDPLVAPYPDSLCPSCAGWNEPQSPFRIFGNTYYVGTRGLSSILVTSSDGHVLIDGGLPDSAPLILDNVRALGFDVADVVLILNSHAHHDHAGGIAALERATGARVASTGPSAPALESGRVGADDPQRAVALDFPAVSGSVEIVADGDTLRAGPLSLTAHVTAGHTSGGTTWSWVSCDGDNCRDMVYADSLTPVSADGFRFTDGAEYPSAVSDFERAFATLEGLSCEILMTPHPNASSFWQRLEAGADALVDGAACVRYAGTAREQLARRLAQEASGR